MLARTGVLSRALALSRVGGDVSSCARSTDAGTSGDAATSIAGASEVASGTIDGHGWTLWSKNGETGSAALEDAGVILDGHAYGLCPGFPNPAELELIDPSRGGSGIVIGVSGYDGPANAEVFVGTPNTFNTGTLLYSGHTVSADGTGFFIGQLPKSACDYSSLELSVKTGSGASQHNLEFGSCNPGKLVTITEAWASGPFTTDSSTIAGLSTHENAASVLCPDMHASPPRMVPSPSGSPRRRISRSQKQKCAEAQTSDFGAAWPRRGAGSVRYLRQRDRGGGGRYMAGASAVLGWGRSRGSTCRERATRSARAW